MIEMISPYPTEDELEKIATWPVVTDGTDRLFGLFRDYWDDHGYWQEYEGTDDNGRKIRVYQISTGGWSGNEDILGALRRNAMFWITCWYQSRRGGHHEFRVRLPSS